MVWGKTENNKKLPFTESQTIICKIVPQHITDKEFEHIEKKW